MVGDSLIVGGRRTPASLEGVSMGEGVVLGGVLTGSHGCGRIRGQSYGEDGCGGHGRGSSERMRERVRNSNIQLVSHGVGVSTNLTNFRKFDHPMSKCLPLCRILRCILSACSNPFFTHV